MSTVASAGYSVARSIGKCSVCARDIATGEKMMGALRDIPTGLERVDVCLACWATYDKSPLLGFWQSTMPEATARKKTFVDDGVLCELFERLSGTTDAPKLNFRFVLGLILMRKRLIVYESTRIEEGREIWSVRFRGREDMLDLLNPKLNEQQVAEVSTQLGEILNGDL
jgi:hypothetical protein